MRRMLLLAVLVLLLVGGCKSAATPAVEPDQPAGGVAPEPGGEDTPSDDWVVSPPSGVSPDDEVVSGPPGADATESSVEATPDGEGECGEATVTDVQVLLMESWPVQVGLVIKGTLPDACIEVVGVQEQRDGNTITLTVQTRRLEDARCAQVVTDFEHRYRLEGGFYSGDYTLDVNGYVVEFHID
jgi:hypothetical protein